MKKYLLFFLIFCSTKSNCQVSLEYLNIITSAAQFTYVGVNYKPDNNWMSSSDWDRMENALSSRQAMYDRGHSICSYEISKLFNLSLINQTNKVRLISFRREVKDWLDANFRNIDLSQQENIDAILNYVTFIYKEPDIRNELRLLKDLNSFYQYINDADPLTVDKGILYEYFNTVMEEIRNYNSSQLTLSFGEIVKDLRQKNYNAFKNEVNQKFYFVPKSLKVSDGWHFVYFLDQEDLAYGKRSVYVSKGKVTIYKRFNGVAENIISGGDIKNRYCKSAIYNTMDSRGVFKNIDIELFFID